MALAGWLLGTPLNTPESGAPRVRGRRSLQTPVPARLLGGHEPNRKQLTRAFTKLSPLRPFLPSRHFNRMRRHSSPRVSPPHRGLWIGHRTRENSVPWAPSIGVMAAFLTCRYLWSTVALARTACHCCSLFPSIKNNVSLLTLWALRRHLPPNYTPISKAHKFAAGRTASICRLSRIV